MAETGELLDPFRNCNFLVELDGITQGNFQECSGISGSIEVIEYREGGNNTTVRKLPGKTTYEDIVLKWGKTSSPELWSWWKRLNDGAMERKNGSIVIYDRDAKTEVARYNFIRAWPNKYEGPSLDAKGSDVAIETLTLSHEGMMEA
jgi:phage tail-like protein